MARDEADPAASGFLHARKRHRPDPAQGGGGASPRPQQAQQQPQQQQKQGWPHLVAGGIAGSAAVLLLHPFDVIKTRLQVQDGALPQAAAAGRTNAAAAVPPQYRGTFDAARTILRAEGARGLYAGLAPSLVGSAVAWGAYLYLYDRIKAWHRQRLFGGGGGGGEDDNGGGASSSAAAADQQRLPALWNLVSAAQSGAVVCVLTNPLWLVKTRLALQQATPAAAASSAATGAAGAATAAAALPYRGMLDALARIGREEGLRGYYKGLAPSLLLQTTHGAVQFAVYEELKALMAAAGGGGFGGGGGAGAGATTAPPSSSSSSRAPATHNKPTSKSPPSSPQSQAPDAPPTTLAVTAAAFASKLAAAVSTYPAQVVRARLQQRFDVQPGRPAELIYTSAWGAARVTLAREGIGGFYKGLLPSLLRVMPQSAITLVVYERVAAALEARFGGGAGASGGAPAGAVAAVAAAPEPKSSGPASLSSSSSRRGGRRRSITDEMAPLEIVADSQAEQ